MPGVGIGQHHRIRQVLTENVRVRDGNHLVVDAVEDECGLVDFCEIREALAGEPSLPVIVSRVMC
jgi:hypothetical protein